jgi:hypothetical protein
MHIVTSVAWHCDSSSFDWMLVLTMTTARANMSPSVILDQPYHVTNLHAVSILCLILTLPPLSDTIATAHRLVLAHESRRCRRDKLFSIGIARQFGPTPLTVIL